MPAGINSKLNVIYDDGQVYFTCNELTLHYLKKNKEGTPCQCYTTA